MVLNASKAPLLYVAAGIIVGLLVIYPLTMTIVWIEFAAERTTAPSLSEFMEARFWFWFIPRVRHEELILAFAALGGTVGLGFGIFTQKYLHFARELAFLEQERRMSVPDLIKGGESDRLEFKSSVRWDVKEQRVNKALEKVIAKTLAGFLNANGGSLIIGVDDDGQVLGLDKDYSTLKHKNADGFERQITDLVRKYLGGDICPILHFTFTTIDAQEICMITTQAAKRPVYVSEGSNAIFYVRSGNSTRQLDVREALDYAASRWG